MANFNKIFDRDRRDSGPRERDFKRRDSGGKRGFSSRDRGDRERPEMHEAICSDCGKRCEVPFKPTGDKPIYCSQCFTNHGGASRSDSRPERGGRDRSRSDRPMYDATCDTCGKRFELPFRPTGEKPVYCNDCFDKEGGSSSTSRSVSVSTNQYKEQFEAINIKLDKILRIISPSASVKEEKKEVIVEKKEIVVEKKKEPVKKAKKVIVKKPVAKKKAKK
jgi:CxxC-x17-CxxC domain-containing protein